MRCRQQQAPPCAVATHLGKVRSYDGHWEGEDKHREDHRRDRDQAAGDGRGNHVAVADGHERHDHEPEGRRDGRKGFVNGLVGGDVAEGAIDAAVRECR